MAPGNGSRYVTWSKLWIVAGSLLSLVFGVGLVVQQLHSQHPHKGAISREEFDDAREADLERHKSDRDADQQRHSEVLRRLDRIERKLEK